MSSLSSPSPTPTPSPSPSPSPARTGVGAALLAALLFGATTPVVKWLTTSSTTTTSTHSDVAPTMGAALLYLGSGIGLAVWLTFSRWRGQSVVPVPRGARGRLALAILAGGALAPVALLFGLQQTSASTSSLLLNLEGVLTAVVAWVVFRENVDRRVLLGMIAIVVGGAVLTVDTGGDAGVGPNVGINVGLNVGINGGALWIVAACAGWAIDNNLTQAASSADPRLVAGLKGLGAGTFNLLLSLLLGAELPPPGVALSLAVAGFLGYGASLALFVVALRHLGTARTGAYFGAAPFLGVVVAVGLFGESVGPRLVVAAVLMAIGLWLHLTEHHEHEHTHEALDHEHVHVHDEHHQHDHGTSDPPVDRRGRHSHPHHHTPLTHRHEHVPDLHHRHEHQGG